MTGAARDVTFEGKESGSRNLADGVARRPRGLAGRRGRFLSHARTRNGEAERMTDLAALLLPALHRRPSSLVQQMFRIVRQVLVDLGQHARVLMAHQNCDSE